MSIRLCLIACFILAKIPKAEWEDKHNSVLNAVKIIFLVAPSALVHDEHSKVKQAAAVLYCPKETPMSPNESITISLYSVCCCCSGNGG
jgi:hypothetical protein